MPKQTSIQSLFESAVELGASDVHLIVGRPSMVRVSGRLQLIGDDDPALEREDVAKLVRSVLTTTQMERLEKERELDCSYQLGSGTRFRINCHYERENPGLVARIIPDRIPSLEDVQMPDIVKQFASLDKGIVLFTGPTGSGKSTSLAVLIEAINTDRDVHIVTLEDPIEFLYQSKKSIVRQRQFGTDFLSYGEALKRVLRQDPDVILVGEMRDLETIGAALTLAETGHLVFGTLHTPSAAQTVDRIIDVFPSHQQDQVRLQLSLSLVAIVAQQLVPKKGGGRCAVREILLDTPAVANIIRENRIAELQNVLQMGAEEGMITWERDMSRLLEAHLVAVEIAKKYAPDVKVLEASVKDRPKKRGLFG